MSVKFDYLKKYVSHNDLKGTYFLPVFEEEISAAEKILGFNFPRELKNFYNQIGAGILSCGEKYPEMFAESVTNEILPPLVVANFSKGILLWEGQDHWMAEDTYELLEPGDLPFFEVGDSNYFLIMKPHSNNPSAVYDMGGNLVEDSFERFIWRLYYEDPSYYARGWSS
jgi:hypothetical protein